MKSRKIISVVLIALMAVTSALAFTSCKAKEKKPETLEEYVEQTEDAKEELDDIGESMSNDMLDGNVEVKGNDLIFTMKFKETYDESYFDAMREAMEDKVDEYKSTFNDAISDIEKGSGIDDVGLRLIVLNGDDAEIYSVDLE